MLWLRLVEYSPAGAAVWAGAPFLTCWPACALRLPHTACLAALNSSLPLPGMSARPALSPLPTLASCFETCREEGHANELAVSLCPPFPPPHPAWQVPTEKKDVSEFGDAKEVAYTLADKVLTAPTQEVALLGAGEVRGNVCGLQMRGPAGQGNLRGQDWGGREGGRKTEEGGQGWW